MIEAFPQGDAVSVPRDVGARRGVDVRAAGAAKVRERGADVRAGARKRISGARTGIRIVRSEHLRLEVEMEPRREHPITIAPNPNRVRVQFNGRVVADTTRALTLKEGSLPPVQYIPREDADMSLLERTAQKTHCPYKNDAAYYTIRAGGRAAENAVWTYEEPYPAVAAIKGHLAFYPDRVDRIDELPASPRG